MLRHQALTLCELGIVVEENQAVVGVIKVDIQGAMRMSLPSLCCLLHVLLLNFISSLGVHEDVIVIRRPFILDDVVRRPPCGFANVGSLRQVVVYCHPKPPALDCPHPLLLVQLAGFRVN